MWRAGYANDVSAPGGTVVVAGGVVYVSQHSRYETPYRPTTLLAFDAASCTTGLCQLLWSTDVFGDATISVSDGRLLASTAFEGTVAFAPTAVSP